MAQLRPIDGGVGHDLLGTAPAIKNSKTATITVRFADGAEHELHKVHNVSVGDLVKLDIEATGTKEYYPYFADRLNITVDDTGSGRYLGDVEVVARCDADLHAGDRFGPFVIVYWQSEDANLATRSQQGCRCYEECIVEEPCTPALTPTAASTTAATATSATGMSTKATPPNADRVETCIGQYRGPLREMRGKLDRFANVIQDSEASCAQLCDRASNSKQQKCKAFSYRTDLNRCWLFPMNSISLDKDIQAASFYDHYYMDLSCPAAATKTASSAAATTTTITTAAAAAAAATPTHVSTSTKPQFLVTNEDVLTKIAAGNGFEQAAVTVLPSIDDDSEQTLDKVLERAGTYILDRTENDVDAFTNGHFVVFYSGSDNGWQWTEDYNTLSGNGPTLAVVATAEEYVKYIDAYGTNMPTVPATPTVATAPTPTKLTPVGSKVTGKPQHGNKTPASTTFGSSVSDHEGGATYQAVGTQGNASGSTDGDEDGDPLPGKVQSSVLAVTITAVLLLIVAILIALFLLERRKQSRDSIDLTNAEVRSTAHHSSSRAAAGSWKLPSAPAPALRTNSPKALAALVRTSSNNSVVSHTSTSSEALYGGRIRQSSLLLQGRLSTGDHQSSATSLFHGSGALDATYQIPIEHTYTDPVGGGQHEYDQCDDQPRASFAENPESYYSTINSAERRAAEPAGSTVFDSTHRMSDAAGDVATTNDNRPNSYVDFRGVMASQYGRKQRPLSRQYTYEVPNILTQEQRQHDASSTLYATASESHASAAATHEEAMAMGLLYENAGGNSSNSHSEHGTTTTYEAAASSVASYITDQDGNSMIEYGTKYEAASLESSRSDGPAYESSYDFAGDRADERVLLGAGKKFEQPLYDYGITGAAVNETYDAAAAQTASDCIQRMRRESTDAGGVGALHNAPQGSAAVGKHIIYELAADAPATTTPQRMSTVAFPQPVGQDAAGTAGAYDVASGSFDPMYDVVRQESAQHVYNQGSGQIYEGEAASRLADDVQQSLTQSALGIVYEAATPTQSQPSLHRTRPTPLYVRPPSARSSGASRASDGSTYRTSPLGSTSRGSSSSGSGSGRESSQSIVFRHGSVVSENRGSSGSGSLRLSSPLAGLQFQGRQSNSSDASIKFSAGSISLGALGSARGSSGSSVMSQNGETTDESTNRSSVV